jgi:hypothetical protein
VFNPIYIDVLLAILDISPVTKVRCFDSIRSALQRAGRGSRSVVDRDSKPGRDVIMPFLLDMQCDPVGLSLDGRYEGSDVLD